MMNLENSSAAILPLTIGLCLGVLLMGLALGWIACNLRARYMRKKETVADQPIVDENTAIRCGACMSFIQSKPIFVTVAAPDSYKVYRCEQCATEVSVKI